jgi:hypothetical protein
MPASIEFYAEDAGRSEPGCLFEMIAAAIAAAPPTEGPALVREWDHAPREDGQVALGCPILQDALAGCTGL